MNEGVDVDDLVKDRDEAQARRVVDAGKLQESVLRFEDCGEDNQEKKNEHKKWIGLGPPK
jgi:hypothetical protein